MPSNPRLRLAALLGGALAVTSLVVAAPDGTPPPARTQVQLASYPTNAAKIFRWGNAEWNDEFIGPLKSMWSVNKPGLVRNQHGMLTLNSTSTSGTVSSTLTGHARSVGRWEARVRARQYSHGHTPYHVVWELIPTKASAYHCGARSIVLADYALGSSRTHLYLRNTPNLQFSASKQQNLNNEFHTYAVEVTKSHISWFVDTHVIRTERRSQALSGASYKVRFRLVGKRGATMDPGRMQMDWMRHYTLERKNARSIAAPQTQAGVFAGAC